MKSLLSTRSPAEFANRQDGHLPPSLIFIALAAGSILFAAAVVRHVLFNSASSDLGIFDQALYLIARDETPFVTLTSFHILGDHAAVIFYPLSFLYRIFPSPFWLLLLQSGALSLTAVAIYSLARERQIPNDTAIALACAYLLHPLVFNANLFDFHTDTFAPAAIVFAVIAIERHRLILFTVLVVITLSCKAAFSLTVIGMGIWLLAASTRPADDDKISRRYRTAAGTIAIILGLIWLWVSARYILPAYNPVGISAVIHFKHLGSSPVEIFRTIIFNPRETLAAIFTLRNFEYLALLFIPLLWGLSIRCLLPLIAALPALGLNLLATQGTYKDLVHHYSLPILPFLFIAIIESVSRKCAPVRKPSHIVICALIGFLVLAKFGYFFSIYLVGLDNRASALEALKHVGRESAVVASDHFVPHLTHRRIIRSLHQESPSRAYAFDYVLIDSRRPGWLMNKDTAAAWIDRLDADASFTRLHQRDGIHLFRRKRT